MKNAVQAIQMVPDYNPVDDISIGRRQTTPDEQLRCILQKQFRKRILRNSFSRRKNPLESLGSLHSVLLLLGVQYLLTRSAYRSYQDAVQEVAAEPE